MRKDDFLEMIKKSGFDEGMKQLFITSYCIGYDQGKVEQMKNVLNHMDLIAAERQMEFSTKQ
jgi:Cu2+-containing amine oxidase